MYPSEKGIRSNVVPLSVLGKIEYFDKETTEVDIGHLHISFLRIKVRHCSLRRKCFKTQCDKWLRANCNYKEVMEISIILQIQYLLTTSELIAFLHTLPSISYRTKNPLDSTLWTTYNPCLLSAIFLCIRLDEGKCVSTLIGLPQMFELLLSCWKRE